MDAYPFRVPVGRGDLVRVLHAARRSRKTDPAELAEYLGFEAPETDFPDTQPPEDDVGLTDPGPTDPEPAAAENGAGPLRARLLGALVVPEPDAPADDEPPQTDPGLLPLALADWLDETGSQGDPPPMPPIVTHRRLLPALLRAARAPALGGLDVTRLVTQLARRQLTSPPRFTRYRQAPQVLVVLDLDGPLSCFRSDLAWLLAQLQREVSRSALEVRLLAQGRVPLAGWLPNPLLRLGEAVDGDDDLAHPPKPWSTLPSTTRVLLFSDLGLAQTPAALCARAWVEWLRVVRAGGCALEVWSPLPLQAGPAHPELAALPAVHWSAAAPLRPRLLARGACHHTPERQALADAIVTRLSCCDWIDAGLIRAMRLSLGAQAIDAGIEQLVWDSADLVGNGLSRQVRPDRLAARRDALAAGADPAELQRCFERAHDYYRRFSMPLVHMHALAFATRPRPGCGPSPGDLAAARRFVERLVAAPDHAGVSITETRLFAQAWLHSRDAQENQAHGWRAPALLQTLLRLEHRTLDEVQLPADISHAELARRFGGGEPRRLLHLLHDSAAACVTLSHAPAGSGQSPLCPTPLSIGSADLQLGPGASRRWLDMSGQNQVDLLPAGSIAAMGSLSVLRTRRATVFIGEVRRPRGLRAWVRNTRGLHLLGPALGPAHLVAGPEAVQLVQRESPSAEAPLAVRVEAFSDGDPRLRFGIDDFGVFADVDFPGAFFEDVVFPDAIQRFRWLEPGEFWMGSPEHERERRDNEGPRQRVRLTQGLWLADSACTQALWQAVMGDNPSTFKGEAENPVEGVSWARVQQFLQQLQLSLPEGVQAVLPSEAQWEYACRAGTETPYSLGRNIDPTQVNYDGKHPYTDAEKGESRGRTVPVKSLPPNPWGLYEMHGNVWEWCADGPRQYREGQAHDPVGPEGSHCTARGGSWFSGGMGCRSAMRHALGHGDALRNLGFRLALRSLAQPAQAQAAERRTRAAGSSAGGARLGPAEPGAQGFSGAAQADKRETWMERVSRLIRSKGRDKR